MNRGVFRTDRPYMWIAASLVGVYMVIIAGATSSIIEAAASCTTWPMCTGSPVGSLDDPRHLVAWGHRGLSLLTGLVLLGATILTWRSVRDRYLRTAVTTGLVLYPIQIGLGALLALSAPVAWISGLHLLIGMIIFSVLIVGLVRALSIDYDDLSIPSNPPDPAELTTDNPQPNPDSLLGHVSLTLRLYIGLMKPRLMWLLCLVAAAGMALAAGPTLSVRLVVTTLAGGVLAIGASGTFNHVLERDLDKHMARTADRPVATHRIPVRNAFLFGVLLAFTSVAIFYSINFLAAVLGLAGSFPALIGAAAATNTIGLPALVLALVIFLWTPAHFYNLALAYKSDYANGGIPMFPVVRSDTSTVHHIFWYLGATFLAVAILTLVSDLGVVYAGTGVVFGGIFLAAVVSLYRQATRRAALRSFHASNLYLGTLLVAVLIDALAV